MVQQVRVPCKHLQVAKSPLFTILLKTTREAIRASLLALDLHVVP